FKNFIQTNLYIYSLISLALPLYTSKPDNDLDCFLSTTFTLDVRLWLNKKDFTHTLSFQTPIPSSLSEMIAGMKVSSNFMRS
ncbi:hypothetical protein, partial [Enterococcus avium]|uniref:hypothetical protein n=1 Tax=Enterococcus avium TaxID=33945 RepID=UPI001E336350